MVSKKTDFPYGDLYTDLSPEKWKNLKTIKDIDIDIDPEEIKSLMSGNLEITLSEIKKFKDIVELIMSYVSKSVSRTNCKFPTPLIIGIAGSVSVGKSTFSKIFQLLLSRIYKSENVELVTSDSFLYPNSILEKKGLMQRKGFPESYNTKLLYDFLSNIQSGIKSVEIPKYSHLVYDIIEDENIIVNSPSILIVEGINVLQTPIGIDDNYEQDISHFFDFSIYLDADEPVIRKWYIERFLDLRKEAFSDENSFFNRFTSINDDEAVDLATTIWETINLRNLNENILPTRNRASMIVKKNENHMIEELWLRKI